MTPFGKRKTALLNPTSLGLIRKPKSTRCISFMKREKHKIREALTGAACRYLQSCFSCHATEPCWASLLRKTIMNRTSSALERTIPTLL